MLYMDMALCRFLLLGTSCATTVLAAQKACYLSDGSLVTNEVPCDPNADVSACCYETEYCISNLYCWAGIGATRVPGACTDETWTSKACGCPCK
jgi:hypothetical protein